MSFLLDTSVISEHFKPPGKIDNRVNRWIAANHSQGFFISAISIGEIQRGICQLPESRKRRVLQSFLDGLRVEYQERILPLDEAVALRWAQEMARSRPLSVLDSLIAATALENGLALATRNTKDVLFVTVVNPWEFEG